MPGLIVPTVVSGCDDAVSVTQASKPSSGHAGPSLLRIDLPSQCPSVSHPTHVPPSSPSGAGSTGTLEFGISAATLTVDRSTCSSTSSINPYTSNPAWHREETLADTCSQSTADPLPEQALAGDNHARPALPEHMFTTTNSPPCSPTGTRIVRHDVDLENLAPVWQPLLTSAETHELRHQLPPGAPQQRLLQRSHLSRGRAADSDGVRMQDHQFSINPLSDTSSMFRGLSGALGSSDCLPPSPPPHSTVTLLEMMQVWEDSARLRIYDAIEIALAAARHDVRLALEARVRALNDAHQAAVNPTTSTPPATTTSSTGLSGTQSLPEERTQPPECPSLNRPDSSSTSLDQPVRLLEPPVVSVDMMTLERVFESVSLPSQPFSWHSMAQEQSDPSGVPLLVQSNASVTPFLLCDLFSSWKNYSISMR